MRNNPDILALAVLALALATGIDQRLAGLIGDRAPRPSESRVMVIESPLIFK